MKEECEKCIHKEVCKWYPSEDGECEYYAIDF